MGIKLIGRSIVYGVDVPLHGNEFRLLVGMSYTALDDDETPRYFDSREAAALKIGRRVPDAHPGKTCTCEICRERSKAFEAVKVAIRGLVALGAIERLKRGQAGQRAEYAILVDLEATRQTAEYRRRVGRVQIDVGKPKPSVQAVESSPFPSLESSPFPTNEGSTFAAKKVRFSPNEELRNNVGDTPGKTSPGWGTSLVPVDNPSGMNW